MYKKNPATVLVVDDDPSSLCLVGDLLSANEYQPILASSGEEALEIVSTGQASIDLLLSNIDMPGINGIVTAKYFCNTYPDIKVLFMSGQMSPPVLFGILGKKVAFLNKPIQFSTLIAKIKAILGR